MAEREGIYISQLPESTSLTDNMLFATDNGADNNSVSAAKLAVYVNKKIDVAGQVNNGVSEANSYTDIKKTEAVNEAVTEANSYSDTKKTEAVSETKEWARGTFSNPNLLINGDFQVWQRGESFTASGYTADRWYSTGALTINKVSNGIQITNNTSSQINFWQKVELIPCLLGKQMRYSINIESIEGVVNSYVNAPSATGYKSSLVIGTNSTAFTLSSSSTLLQMVLQINAGASLVISWIKLEMGEASTPFVPRSYAEELALCQRYYITFGSEQFPAAQVITGSIAGTCSMIFKLPCEMRVTPNISGGYSFNLRGNGKNATVDYSKFSAINNTGNGYYNLKFTAVDSSIFTANSTNMAIINKYSSLFFDAEIY